MLSILRVLAATAMVVPVPLGGGKPDHANLLRRAATLVLINKFNEALDLLEEIPRRNLRGVEYNQIYLLLTEIYFRAKVDYAALSKERFKCLIKTCLEVIESFPHDRRSKWAYYNLALMHFAKGNEREARQLFRQASHLGAVDAQTYFEALEASIGGEQLALLREQARELKDKLTGLSLGQAIWEGTSSPTSAPPVIVPPAPPEVAPPGQAGSEQAASALFQAIKLDPTNLANFLELTALYCRLDQLDNARKVIEWGGRELSDADNKTLLAVVKQNPAFIKLQSAS